MNIVTPNPKAWKLPVAFDASGGITEVRERADEGEAVDNLVFRGKLRYLGYKRKNTNSVQHLFEDEQSGVLLRFSPKTLDALLASATIERTKFKNGRFEGLFTFATFGPGWVFATPLTLRDAKLLGLA